MSSRIEQIIGEIEEYVDSCKFQPLSTAVSQKGFLPGQHSAGYQTVLYHQETRAEVSERDISEKMAGFLL